MAKKARQQKNRPSRTGWRLGGWLLSAFLICWAFILGILVGQGVLATPEQLAWLKQATHLQGWLDQDTAPIKEPLKDPKLSYYDRVQDRRDTPPPAPKPKTKAKPPAPVRVASKPPAQTQPKQAKPAKPAPKPAERTPAPAKAQKRFAVQVASFQDKTQAFNLVRSLQDKGLPAYTQIGKIKGVGRRYRVRVGPYADLDEAKGVASRLRLRYELAAYVTRHQ